MNMRVRAALGALVMAVVVSAVACDGGASDGGGHDMNDMQGMNGTSTSTVSADVTVEVKAEAIRFVPDQISIPVGKAVKIRLVNEMDSDHPMPHPFHIHGAGRFLVLSRDGTPEPNLCWKDTVLLLTGQSVDILLEVTHPGRWMAHCHISEHHESGMMFSFDVDP